MNRIEDPITEKLRKEPGTATYTFYRIFIGDRAGIAETDAKNLSKALSLSVEVLALKISLKFISMIMKVWHHYILRSKYITRKMLSSLRWHRFSRSLHRINSVSLTKHLCPNNSFKGGRTIL